MTTRSRIAIIAGIFCLASVLSRAGADAPATALAATPWPAEIPGWVPPKPGEHPRLFFRKADLPEIRKLADTPEGKVIVARLRELLGGGEGMPTEFNPNRGPQPDGSGAFHETAPEGKTFTLWHAAGFGMLYRLTGEQKYADLGRQCAQKMLEGQRDRDNRYSFRDPMGALRAGPSLGAMAMAYDLNYDGWDQDFRTKVALAIQDYNEGGPSNLPGLVRGSRHGPQSNHWGPQVGGGALAVLAVMNDPGVDMKKIEPLLDESAKAMVRNLTEGFGDGGMFWEGKGPGGISSDTAFVPALQAWRVAGGKDFVTPRPNAPAVTLIKVHELLTIKGEPWYLIDKPSGYGFGYFGPHAKGGQRSDRDGLSRGGQFAQGFGAIPDEVKPAALWAYNHVVEPDEKARTYDTVSLYPHRAVLALVNWPIGIEGVNPAEILPKVHYDTRLRHYAFRNQWTGTDDDILVNATFGGRDGHPLMVWGKGQKLNFGACPLGEVTHFQPAEDGSGTVTAFGMALGVDFSKASGADALVVVTGNGAAGQKQVSAGGTTFHLTTLGGEPAEPRVEGDTVVMGGQTFSYDGKKIVFGKMAGPGDLPRMGLGGLALSVPRPPVIKAGEALPLGGIRFRGRSKDARFEAMLAYRPKEGGEFRHVPLRPAADGKTLAAEIPASATAAGPVEYFVRVQEEGQPKPVTHPPGGAEAPAEVVPDAAPPELPAPPRAPQSKSYAVSLQWEPATDDLGVAGYEVYRAADEAALAEPGSLLATLDAGQTQFRDGRPPAGQKAVYAVRPLDLAGRQGELRTVPVAVPNDQPPVNGLELTATSGPEAVVVAWRGDVEPDVTELQVLRSAGDGEPQQVAVVKDPAKSARWVDDGVERDTEYRYQIRLKDAGGHVSEPKAARPVTAGRYLRRVNCGGGEVVGPDGVAWERDDGPVANSDRFVAAAEVEGAPEELREVYRSERWSYNGVRYVFDGLAPGKYVLVLHLAETNQAFMGEGKRTFDVVVDGDKRHEAVDVFKSAGGGNRAWQLETPVDVAAGEGRIVVDLLANAAGPAVKGVEVRQE